VRLRAKRKILSTTNNRIVIKINCHPINIAQKPRVPIKNAERRKKLNERTGPRTIISHPNHLCEVEDALKTMTAHRI